MMSVRPQPRRPSSRSPRSTPMHGFRCFPRSPSFRRRHLHQVQPSEPPTSPVRFERTSGPITALRGAATPGCLDPLEFKAEWLLEGCRCPTCFEVGQCDGCESRRVHTAWPRAARPWHPTNRFRASYRIFINARTRASVGGWVANMLKSEFPHSGSMMNRLFWAGLGLFIGICLP